LLAAHTEFQEILLTHGYGVNETVFEWLKDPSHTNWLLVMDSVDDLDTNDIVARFCRDLEVGSIIVTTISELLT